MADTPGMPRDDNNDEVSRWVEFGAYLEALRVRAGLDRKQLAAKAGVSYNSLVVLERGGRNVNGAWSTPNPKDEQLGALAKALGVRVEDLFARVGHYAERPRTQAAKRGPGRYGGDLPSRLARMEARLAALEARLAALEARLAALEARLRELGGEAPPGGRRRHRPG